MTRPPIHRSFLNLFTNKSWIFHPQVYSLKNDFLFYISLEKQTKLSHSPLINCHLHFKLPHLKLFVGIQQPTVPSNGLPLKNNSIKAAWDRFHLKGWQKVAENRQIAFDCTPIPNIEVEFLSLKYVCIFQIWIVYIWFKGIAYKNSIVQISYLDSNEKKYIFYKRD